MLAHVVLNHVPVEDYCFRNKCVYITHIVRRVLKTVLDRSLLDDKVREIVRKCLIYINTRCQVLKRVILGVRKKKVKEEGRKEGRKEGARIRK